jgi:hypothetical protein
LHQQPLRQAINRLSDRITSDTASSAEELANQAEVLKEVFSFFKMKEDGESRTKAKIQKNRLLHNSIVKKNSRKSYIKSAKLDISSNIANNEYEHL